MAARNSSQELQLQCAVWNQTAPSSPPSVPELTLNLRKLSLSPPAPSSPQSRQLTDILTKSQPHSEAITTLDVSHSLLDPHTLATLLHACCKLQCFRAVDCGLSHTLPDTQWPLHLHTTDLSRNKLWQIPQGIEELLFLKTLNLSGNLINTVTPAILKLPHLQQFYLLRNPIQNIPKDVCREGVQAMRDFLHVQPRPTPECSSDGAPNSRSKIVRRLSLEDGRHSLRDRVLRTRIESLESGYDSGARLPSTASSCSSDSEVDSEDPHPLVSGRLASCSEVGIHTPQTPSPSLPAPCELVSAERERPVQSLLAAGIPHSDPATTAWPDFAPSTLPHGYKETPTSCGTLCQLYLPTGITVPVQMDEVRDLSLHPRLERNELLITPVVRISPHGMRFLEGEPAIVLLCHCTRPSGTPGQVFTVLCSNTGPCQLTQWRKLCRGSCDMFKDHVKFSTTHFSLFAVISTFPYPSSELVISSNEGGSLTLPEDCPGFEVVLPVGCLKAGTGETTITATVYYDDSPCVCPPPHQGAELALASPVLGLEPHGIHFSQPVTVTLPIPDYAAIKTALPAASLQLWTAPPDGHPWSCLTNTQLTLHHTGGTHTASFPVHHFSLFEFVWETWDVCKEALMRLGCGAAVRYRNMRTQYVGVRCQVFMTPPIHDLTFTLLVYVYKFGDRVKELGNYPWMLADSGSKRVFLRTGELEATIVGSFTPNQEHDDTSLSQTKTINYRGEDLSQQFDFSLKLGDAIQPPLANNQVLGKLRLSQPGCSPWAISLIKPSSTLLESSPATPQHVPHYRAETPPRTPPHDAEVAPVLIESHPTHSATGQRRADKRRPPRLIPHNQSRSKRKLVLRNDNEINNKLLMHIAKSVGSKYEELGIALGLEWETVSSVTGSVGDPRPDYMRAFHVLQEWKRAAADNLTFVTLRDALEEAGLSTCAQDMCHAELTELDIED